MTLTEIVDYLLVQSGQYILKDFDKTLLSYKQLWRLIEPELLRYGKYRPVVKTFNMYLPSTSYTFLTDIPDWISNVRPIEGSRSSIQSVFASNVTSNLNIPRQFVWKYEKPRLFCQYEGLFDITGMYLYSTVIENDDSGEIYDVVINNLDFSHTSFLDLIHGKFLMTIGKSRRAFTINELPITMDGDTLASEGESLYNDAKEGLYERSYWWKAIGD